MSLCRYVAMCPPLRLATRRRTSLDYVVLVSSCTLYFVGKLNYCCGWKINSIHNTWADRWCECARWLKDVWLYEQNDCMSVRTRRCPVERVGLMRGDDTPATTVGTLHPVTAGAQYYWIYRHHAAGLPWRPQQVLIILLLTFVIFTILLQKWLLLGTWFWSWFEIVLSEGECPGWAQSLINLPPFSLCLSPLNLHARLS